MCVYDGWRRKWQPTPVFNLLTVFLCIREGNKVLGGPRRKASWRRSHLSWTANRQRGKGTRELLGCEWGSVLVCWGCHYRIPQTGCFKQHQMIPHSSGGQEVQNQGNDSVLVSVLFRACQQSSSHCVLTKHRDRERERGRERASKRARKLFGISS